MRRSTGFALLWVCAVGLLLAIALSLVGLFAYLKARNDDEGQGRAARFRSGGGFIGASPHMPPDGKAIVFASPCTGDGDIYLHLLDGLKTIQLTADPNYEGDPRFSSDGKQIVYVRESGGVGHIWIMNADGSGQRQLTSGPDNDEGPSFSADGRRIVFVRRVRSWRMVPGSAASAELFVMDVDESRVTRLTDNTVPDWEASFTPDGKEILFSRSSNEIWMLNLSSGDTRCIGKGSSPSMSTDGASVVFVSGEYGRTISIMNRSGKKIQELFTSESYKSDPSFCRGGSHVLFLDEPDANGTGWISLIRIADGQVTKILRTDCP
jgi:tricorn protease-like protein